jgi:hypothetical protein
MSLDKGEAFVDGAAQLSVHGRPRGQIYRKAKFTHNYEFACLVPRE